MTTKRADLNHLRLGTTGCSRRERRLQKCYACATSAIVLCDYPKELPEGMTLDDMAGMDEESRLKLTTCSRPCCGRHGYWWKAQLHLCQDHANQEEVGT